MTNTITKERRNAIRADLEHWGANLCDISGADILALLDALDAAEAKISGVQRDAISSAIALATAENERDDAVRRADAAEARAAQADHAAACLADMVKDLQAASEAKMGEPVAWRYRYNKNWNIANIGLEWSPWKLMDHEPSALDAEFEIEPLYLYACPPAAEPVIPEGWVLVPVELHPYDAGLLSDWGGGNVEWWQDYLRHELNRAHEFYNSQLAAAPALVSEKEAE